MSPDSSLSAEPGKRSFQVAAWSVDPTACRLERDGETVRVEPKVMQVLEYLAERAGQVVSRRELEEAVWSGTVVGYEAVTNAIIKLRKALGDDARDPRIIETISKSGYRIIADVTPVTSEDDGQPQELERKLAAILYADVAGYSRLMGEDEEGTHRSLSDNLDLLSRSIRSHGGSVVHYAGDAVLAEFDAATKAVTCAVEAQHELRERNAELPESQRVEFRIGINLGEVIVDRGDIYGDGVNVAARLEGLAEPGGICIADSVRIAVRGKLLLGYEPLGEQQVKNIDEPVRAYRVTAEQEQRAKTSNRRKPVLAIAAVLLVIGVGALAWWQPWVPEFEPARVADMAYPLPDEPSIAVMPFDNFSGAEQDTYVAYAMTEDIITALSNVPEFFVISRISSFAYKGKPKPVKQVAEELGVRYILEGSIQRSGEQIRVTAQLIDAVKGHHLWAENFDGRAQDLFVLQDDIVRRIMIALQGKLSVGDHARVASRGTTNLKAWQLRTQAMPEIWKFNKEGTVRARELLTAAHEADPNWGRPLGGIAWSHWWEAKNRWSPDRKESIRLGVELAQKAIAVDPNDTLGYMQLGNLMQLQGDHDQAVALREKAVAIAPNDFQTNWGLGCVLFKAGQAERAVQVLKRAQRLSPRYPASLLWCLAMAQLVAGQYQASVETGKRAIARRPDHLYPRYTQVAALTALGRMDEARVEAKEVLRIKPDFTVSAWKLKQSFKDQAVPDHWGDLLVNAGLPE